METHPDRGGSQEDFQQVQLAYSILSDSEKRKRYDVTGEIDPSKIDNSLAEIMQFVSTALTAVLEDLACKGKKPHQEDILAMMRTTFNESLTHLRNQRKPIEQKRENISQLLGRFTVEDGGDNTLEGAIKFHISDLDKHLKQIDDNSERIRKALEYLRKYRFRADPKDPMPAGWAHGNTVNVMFNGVDLGKMNWKLIWGSNGQG
jgi:curved DNA-binding protein CbpA